MQAYVLEGIQLPCFTSYWHVACRAVLLLTQCWLAEPLLSLALSQTPYQPAVWKASQLHPPPQACLSSPCFFTPTPPTPTYLPPSQCAPVASTSSPALQRLAAAAQQTNTALVVKKWKTPPAGAPTPPAETAWSQETPAHAASLTV